MEDKVIAKSIDDLESMPEFQCGLWYSPYVKIYSIGGPNRIAEISNYPRAYKDTTPHVYTEDTPFIVSESDLNDEVAGERVYRDSQDKTFRVGEEATHWIGDSLLGAFPLWIESEDLPFTADQERHIFPLSDVPGPIKGLAEAQQKVEAAFEKLPEEAVTAMKEALPTGKITLARKAADSDKQIARIKYRRVF